MSAPVSSTKDLTFDFDYYRFNGPGERPKVVASLEQAHFIRSRRSVEKPLIELARERVDAWSTSVGITARMKEPYPSNAPGRFWIEFYIGGLSL